MIYWFAGCIAASSLIGALLYRRLWLHFKRDGSTPMGYGVLLPVAVLVGAVATHASTDLIATNVVIAIVTVVYWCDDAFGLPVGLRFFLQFATGAAIAYLLLAPVLGGNAMLVLASCAAAGVFNVGLTNIANFYDGADLNLAIFMVLTAICVLVADPAYVALKISAIIVLAFVLPFGVLNSRPKTLYFGDAGSFAFASIITAGAILGIRSGETLVSFAGVPLALPAFDAFYVIVLRIVRREHLLTRNYHHLYQQLQIRHPGFFYLVPQVVAVVFVSAGALVLLRLGLHPLLAVVASAVTVTPLFYVACRRAFLGQIATNGSMSG